MEPQGQQINGLSRLVLGIEAVFLFIIFMFYFSGFTIIMGIFRGVNSGRHIDVIPTSSQSTQSQRSPWSAVDVARLDSVGME